MKRLFPTLLAALLAASLVVACSGGASGGTGAQPASKGIPKAAEGTALRKIQDRGKFVAGVKYDQPTFGYLNPKTNKLEGFDIDLSKAIAREILGNEDAIEFKQAVSKDRIPFLEQGVVDFIAATMTANEDRAKQIEFTDTYYVAGQSLLVPKNSDITGLASLNGKSVATVKGSTPEQNIRQKAPGANVVLFDTYSECIAAMDSGRAQAVTTDDIILLGYQQQSPDKYKVVGGQFTVEPYAVGIPKGQMDVLDAVNTAMRSIVKSGEWAKIYEKNLGGKAPAPPPQDWREVYKMKPSGA
jgi:putative glutamine transport system substrate-binding protein